MAGSVYRGVLRRVDKTAYRADVELGASDEANLVDVRVSRGIASGELVVGRVVAVVAYEDFNPDDTMIVGVWA